MEAVTVVLELVHTKVEQVAHMVAAAAVQEDANMVVMVVAGLMAQFA